jgi:single-stranded-DNA-specific exonuclease
MLIRRRKSSAAAQSALAVPALLRRVLAARQVLREDDRALDFQYLLPPSALSGIDSAVALLMAQLPEQRRILIVSDFDADGATSCVLALRALRAMGFAHVDYIVPNRFEYGYGLTPEIVELARSKAPDLLLTVDNGIASLEGVRAARALGIQVLITDHHLPGMELPEADAIVNPNQQQCCFPSKALAGVGVVFYVMAALRSALREACWFVQRGIAEPHLAAFLDLVALGTVADVVPLDRNNRILVNEGLKRIRAGKACPGILALLALGKRSMASLQASDLGFAAGPRLNAAGRLDDMALGIECLLCDQPERAMRIAQQLDEMNERRKSIEEDMRDQALQELEALEIAPHSAPAGVCLFHPQWHQGVIGILAARIKERLHRPVIAFARAGADENGEPQLKGSARSIAGLHIRDVLDTLATRNPGLISRFGGHAMAAGLSLRECDYPRFSQAFAELVAAQLSEEALQACILTDGEVTAEELTLATAQLLREAGPWGQGFPEPSFDGEFDVLQQRLLGERHLKLVLCPPGRRGLLLDAIAFNVQGEHWSGCKVSRIRAVYRLDVNEFRGQRNLQLIIDQLEPVQE